MAAKKNLLGKIFKGTVKGLVKNLPIISSVNDIVENIKEDTENSPEGKVDWARLIITVLLGGGMLFLLYKGMVNYDQLEAFFAILLN